MRRSAMVMMVLVASMFGLGCGPASEDASLQLAVDEGGAWVGVQAATSASGVDLELEWTMVVTNHGSSPCAVAIYQWTEQLPPDGTSLPTASADPPTTWEGGEWVDGGVVEAGARLSWGPTLVAAPDELVAALWGVAVCPDATLELEVRAEAFADLGIRSLSDALTLELWRAG